MVAQPSTAALSAAVRRSVYVQVAAIGLRCPDPDLLHESRVSAPEVSRELAAAGLRAVHNSGAAIAFGCQ